mgnify:CR=1 FL=1
MENDVPFPFQRGACLIRTDAMGDTLWTKYFDGTGMDFGKGDIQLFNDGFLINCLNNVIHTDTLGNIRWAKDIFMQSADVLIQDSTFIMIADDQTTLHVANVDTSGSILWETSFSFEDPFQHYQLTTKIVKRHSGNLLISGVTLNDTSSVMMGSFHFNLDPMGNMLSSYFYDTEHPFFDYQVFERPEGLVGFYTNQDFTMPFPGVYLRRMDSAGFDGGCRVLKNHVTDDVLVPLPWIDVSFTTYSGMTYGNLAVDSVSSPPLTDTDLCIPSSIQETNVIRELDFFPNPTSSTIEIADATFMEKGFQIFNLQGKLVKQGVLESNQIDVSELSAGSYFLKISADDVIHQGMMQIVR